MAVDAKFGDEGFAHCLAFGGCARVDDLGDPVPDLMQVGGVGCAPVEVEHEGQLVASVA
ncbi:hypothetical protein WEI85_00880 [Actinomycetes bacterium KLBMP 9797]